MYLFFTAEGKRQRETRNGLVCKGVRFFNILLITFGEVAIASAHKCAVNINTMCKRLLFLDQLLAANHSLQSYLTDLWKTSNANCFYTLSGISRGFQCLVNFYSQSKASLSEHFFLLSLVLGFIFQRKPTASLHCRCVKVHSSSPWLVALSLATRCS